MLKRVRFQNFKCLRDVSVELAPLTVLIGPNDSGKSSFLQAIQFVRQSVMRQVLDGMKNEITESVLGQSVWMRDRSLPVSFSYILEIPPQQRIEYALECRTSQRGVWNAKESLRIGDKERISHAQDGRASFSDGEESGKVWGPRSSLDDGTVLSAVRNRDGVPTDSDVLKELLPIHDFFRTLQPFHLRTEASIQPVVLQVGSVPYLRIDGYGLPAVLDWMLNEHRESFLRVEEELCRLAPSIAGISLPLHELNVPETNWQNMTMGEVYSPPVSVKTDVVKKIGKGLEFVLAGSHGKKVPASQISEGILLMLGYLTILYHPHSPGLLLIEEPDNQIHPRRVEFVMQKLRAITEGTIGPKACQVILTTHNPLLLNFAQPEEVRMFTRNTEHATQVTPMNEVENIEKLLEFMDLGELWYNLGEEALVKSDENLDRRRG